jgi:hypothetical protein
MLLLLQGYGSIDAAPLVTGRQNYIKFQFRDKRGEFEHRNNILAPDFRDKRGVFEYRKNTVKIPLRNKRLKYE